MTKKATDVPPGFKRFQERLDAAQADAKKGLDHFVGLVSTHPLHALERYAISTAQILTEGRHAKELSAALANREPDTNLRAYAHSILGYLKQEVDRLAKRGYVWTSDPFDAVKSSTTLQFASELVQVLESDPEFLALLEADT